MRVKSIMRGSTLIAALFAVAGCVNLTPDTVYPLGQVVPINPSELAPAGAVTQDSIRTARAGDILLRQSVQSSTVYVLENDVEPDGNISLAVQERTLDLDQGDEFYIALALGQEEAVVACSLERPAVHIPRLNPGASASGKICFVIDEFGEEDTLSDINIDQAYLEADQFFFAIDGAFMVSENGTPYQAMTRWDQQLIYAVTPAAQLRRVESEPRDGAPELALRFVSAADGFQIEPVYILNGRPQATNDKPVPVSADDTFPVTLEIKSAEIEILALTEGVLAYRIQGGFDADSIIILDLPE